jgi:hypothetical protein
MRFPTLIASVFCSACAAAAPAAGPPSVAPPSASAPPPAAQPAATSSEATYDDPGEAHDPATLEPLFGKGATPTFPKGTVDQRDCWQTVRLTGAARADFDALVAACGTPTGSVEYVKPAVGKLHDVKDRRDTYFVHVRGGLCYRFFGVADQTITDLDILIETGSGALVGEDKARGPVAIIESDKSWCMQSDGDYKFGVQISGTGTGSYVFGAWARPKS